MQSKNLKTSFLGRNMFYYKTIDSTQKEVFRRIEENNIKNGTVIYSDLQTSGVGTHGRVWYTDEENNIVWAKKLEKAGCHVIYGLLGLKTHSKITLVVRKEEEGIRRYVHLGTGNYNDSTAKQYTDCGILTCAAKIGEDATAVFNMLSGYSEPDHWNELVLAPIWLRKWLIKKINRETEFARKGMPASIIAKMNSLCDKEVIDALYEASSALVLARMRTYPSYGCRQRNLILDELVCLFEFSVGNEAHISLTVGSRRTCLGARGLAVSVVVGYEKLQVGLSGLYYSVRMCYDYHARGDGGCAGFAQLRISFDLYHTKSAGAVNLGSFVVAERRNKDIVFSGDFKNGLSRKTQDFFAVYVQSEFFHSISSFKVSVYLRPFDLCPAFYIQLEIIA